MGTLEKTFQDNLRLALGSRPFDIALWRQNTGQVEVTKKGKIVGVFHAGPPDGAADLSGICRPGYRLEIELKGAKTPDQPGQAEWGEMIKRLGGVHVKIRYDESMTMAENVVRGVRMVQAARREREREDERWLKYRT